jgi:hypothetical protein
LGDTLVSLPARLRRRDTPARRAAALRRGLVVVVACTLPGVAAGVWWGDRTEAVHEATAVILVNPLEGNPFSPDGTGDELVNLETEAHLVTSDSVGRLVGRRTGGDTPLGELLAGISVTVPPNTQILQITARAAASADAVERAQAFAETYLAYRQARSESELFDRAAQVQEQIGERNAELRRTATALDAAAARSPQALLLQQELAEITSQIGQLRTQRAVLETQPANPGQVVTPAAVPSSALPGWTVLGGVAGGALGLGCAIAMVTVRARRDPRISDVEDLVELLAVVDVPYLGPSDQPVRIRGGLLAAATARPLVVLLGGLGGADPDRSCAPGLSSCLARAELETVLVDLEHRDGTAGASKRLGLVDLLLERTTAHDLLGDDVQVGYVGAGTTPPRLDDLTSAPRMWDLVEELRKRADVVLLAGGPLGEARTRALLPLADRVVLEVGDLLTADGLTRAVDEVRRCGSTLAGVVRQVPGEAAR